MSTQINVSVDSGGLSQAAKEQTAANRQAKIEATQRTTVEKEAKTKQIAARKSQLLGPDGTPLYGPSIPALDKKEEPIAVIRQTAYEWKIMPTSATQISELDFEAETRGAKVKPLLFTAVVNGGASGNQNVGSSGSGPGGNGLSLRNASRGGFLGATSTDFPMTGKPDFTFESYVRSNGVPEFSGARFSVEQYVWILGENYFDDGGPNSRSHYIWTQYKINPFDSSIVTFEVHYERSSGGGNIDGATYTYDVNNNTGSLSAPHATPGFNVPLHLNQWFHIAVTRKADTWYFFLNGILAAYGSDADNIDDGNATKTTINGVTDYLVSSSQVDMAKTRFIRKALYTKNFTPP